MKLRILVYRYMSVGFLRNRVDLNYEKLKTEKNSNKRMKILGENFDVLEALIYKQRHNPIFLSMVHKDLTEVINKNKVEESK